MNEWFFTLRKIGGLKVFFSLASILILMRLAIWLEIYIIE